MAQDVVALSEQQSAFVRFYVESGNAKTAATLAGYSINNHRVMDSPKVARAIAIAMRQALAADAVAARTYLRSVVDGTETPNRGRIDAAKTLLDRAGYIAPKAQAEKPGEAPLHEMSTGELRDLAARLEDEIAGRARPISAIPVPTGRVEEDPTLELFE